MAKRTFNNTATGSGNIVNNIVRFSSASPTPITLIPPLEQFCTLLSKQDPRIKIGVNYDCSKSTDTYGGQQYREVWAYYPEQEFAVLKIGFGDYKTKYTGDFKYAVWSRTITSGRTDARKLEVAVRNALRAIRPYTPGEVASYNVESLLVEISKVRLQATLPAATAWGEIVGASGPNAGPTEILKTEFKNMLATGYPFHSLLLKEKIEKWNVLEEAAKEMEHRAVHMLFLRLRGNEVEIIPVMDVPIHYRSTLRPKLLAAVVFRKNKEELCSSIVGRAATLDMVDPHEYVDGVGMRMDVGTYWIERNIEEEQGQGWIL